MRCLVLVLVISASVPASAQTRRGAPVVMTLPSGVVVTYDPVVGATTEQLALHVGGPDGVSLTFTILYRGTHRLKPASAIELVVARDAEVPSFASNPHWENEVRLFIDGKRIRVLPNRRMSDDPHSEVVAMIMSSQVASRFAAAVSVEGHVLDYDFALMPDQLATVGGVLREWTTAP